jgi:hypothetical protein
MRRQARRQLVQRPFRGDVRQLTRHRPVILTGGEEHHAPTGRLVPDCRKRLHQQQGRTGVDGEGQVDLSGREILQREPAAAGVVGHHDVEPTERAAGRGHEVLRRVRVGEVGADMGCLPPAGS